MSNVRHLHAPLFLIDGEQNAVVAEDELAKTDAKPLVLRSVSAATWKSRQALYRLEDSFDPTLRRERRFARDVVVDVLNVPQCPWREKRPVEGTWLGTVA